MIKFIFAFLLACTFASAATSPEVITNDKLKLGRRASGLDKTIEFDAGLSPNPKMLAKSDGTAITSTPSKLIVGNGSAADRTVEFDIGSGSGNPKLKWDNATSKLRFANDGATFSDISGASVAVRNEIHLRGGNGHGSTNTFIRRFATTFRSSGSCIVYADSATLGATFTIQSGCDGMYTVVYQDCRSNGSYRFGLSLNSTQLTTSILSITNADALSIVNPQGADEPQIQVHVPVWLVAGDVIRAHTDGTPNDLCGSSSDRYYRFIIVKNN